MERCSRGFAPKANRRDDLTAVRFYRNAGIGENTEVFSLALGEYILVRSIGCPDLVCRMPA